MITTDFSNPLHPLLANQLKANIDLSHLKVTSTADLTGDSGFLGQPRAKKSLEFGIAMQGTGYNLFVMGESGTGRHSLVSKYVKQLAASEKTPTQWAYVNQFDNPREPLTLELAASQTKALLTSIDTLIDDLMDTFPAVFENPAYQRKNTAIDKEFNEKYDQAMAVVERFANQQDVAVISDSNSVMLLPVIEGKALDETQFAQLPEQERSVFQRRISEIEAFLNEQLLELPIWKRRNSEQQRQLNKETVQQAIKPLLKELEVEYQSQLSVLRYLKTLKKHLPELVLTLFIDDANSDLRSDQERKQSLQQTLKPNILNHHQPNDGAPVVYERLPTYQNLFGRIEYSTHQGMAVTHFQNIRPGSLLQANGGYLILHAEKLLTEPFAWDALKLALQTKQLKMESPFVDASLLHSITLNPQSIPLNIKIILLGSRDIYYQLQAWDPEFNELFRVPVDFDNYIPINPETIDHLALRIKAYGEDKQLKPLTLNALKRLIEYSLREAEHQKRLSAQVIKVFKVYAEANFLAPAELAIIDEPQIAQALIAADYRNSRIADQMLADIEEGTVLIDTQGTRAGCVNGLTVMEVGDSHFGSPARITATVHVGAKGVVDIEREVELGQAIHSKGVMILSGFLGHEFGRQFPLTLSAHIAMEQSYGHVDGDSATLAEYCALISAISQIPLNQSLAVTGSMNQLGEIQAIGGVNEKIEGFFKLCQQRGLTGQQGVIIPADNAKHLMLDEAVIQAVEQQAFRIYAVRHLYEALHLLTGLETGQADQKGNFAEQSVNGQTQRALKQLYEQYQDAE